MTNFSTSAGGHAASTSEQRVVVEFCQFVFFVRLLGLAYLSASGGDRSPTELVVLLALGAVSVVGTFFLHRMQTMVVAHPIILAVDIALVASAIYVSDADAGYVALGLTTALLIGLLSVRPGSLLLFGLLTAATAAAGLYSIQDSDVVPIRQFAMAPLALALCYASASIVRDRLTRLSEQNTETKRALATSEERQRLAREMHDGVVKTLHGLALSAQGIADHVDAPDSVRSMMARFKQAADHGVDQAREVLMELRVEQDDRPLGTVVQDLVERWSQRSRVPASVEVNGIVDLPGDCREVIVSCLREALDNIAEHAGADRVMVTLSGNHQGVEVQIGDDGRGYDEKRLRASQRNGHFGVRGLHERAAGVGGACEIHSEPHGGTQVRVTVPQPTRRRDRV